MKQSVMIAFIFYRTIIKKEDNMPKFTIIQTYKMQDIWKNVEAKNKEEAVDICMAGKDVDENNPDYTNDIIEIYQEELHYVGGEK